MRAYFPLDKLRENLRRCREEEEEEGAAGKEKEEEVAEQNGQKTIRKKLVLITTGTYSPVHRMHLHVFEAAKKLLEEKHGFQGNNTPRLFAISCHRCVTPHKLSIVVAGFVSPSHDEYVWQKLETDGIAGYHREAMLQLATKDSDWISVSTWELNQPYFQSMYKATLALHGLLREEFAEQEELQVMYLCGADLIPRCGGMTNLGGFPIVAVGRAGYSDKVRKVLAAKQSDSAMDGAPRKQTLYFVEEDTEDISSTKMREYLREGKDLSSMTFPSVIEYLHAHQNDQGEQPFYLQHHPVPEYDIWRPIPTPTKNKSSCRSS
ncbi:Nicotinamide/nicotinic acid mononucleotide adenylyltransferase 1 [Balamuthia mandrillaris]